MTLYADLNVPPDADRATLSRAHRDAVKRHHPDAGGDRDKFERVQRAWLVLRDPEKRARYDETGQADDAPDNELSALTQILVQAFDRVLAETATIMGQVDVITRMVTALRHDGVHARQKIAHGRRVRQQIEDARKRLSFGGSGPDVIARVLDERANQADAQIAAMEREIASIERAAEHLKLYGWEFEKAEAPMFTASARTGTTTMGWR